MKNFFIIATVAITLAACSATKKAQKPVMPDAEKPAPDSVVAPETISTVLEKMNHVTYKTFSGKADVAYAGGGKEYNLDAKIAIKKDELIWVSITATLGIEAARCVITKDSVKILNKLQKTYIATSINYLQDKFGLPLNLTTLQDLLVGNAVFIDNGNSSYNREGDNLQITSQTQTFRNLLTLMMPAYLPAYSKLDDVDAAKKRSAELTYEDYKAEGDFSFSRKRKIVVNYKNKITVDLNYKNYNFNQAVSTPFSIPSTYKKTL